MKLHSEVLEVRASTCEVWGGVGHTLAHNTVQ